MRWVVGAAALVSLACVTDEREKTAQRAEALMKSAPVRSGALELHCVPEDAEVSVDGVPQGVCADFDGETRRLALNDGMHRVDVKKAGYLPYETYYQPSGAKAVLRIELAPAGNTEGEVP